MSPFRKLLPIIVLPLALACRRHEGNSAPSAQSTQTIPPAAAQPAPTDTEALTQTVDIEDSRSEAEGGTAAATPAKAPPKKAPAKKTKK